MAGVRAHLAVIAAACACDLVAAGCSSEAKKAEAAPARPAKLVCPNRTAWQHLADRVNLRGYPGYTLSEHVAPPLTYNHVVRYLHQELKSLVLVRPTAET